MDENQELQIEDQDNEDGEIYYVYDIASYPSDYTLRGIVDKWDKNDISIPDFQREFVWSMKQSSLLIESFLLGLPVPPVFFYIDSDNNYLVIDGQQRILSIVYFFSGYFGIESSKGKKQVFRLSGLNERSPYFKKTYQELAISDRRKLDSSVLRAINVRQLSPSDESTSMYHIFERLNTGGTPLKSQEIRNVVFRGEFVNILKNLNNNRHWRSILGTPKPNKHQTDVELLLRLFSLYIRLEQYEKPMKEFLNIAMKNHQNGNTKEVEDFVVRFKEVCRIIVTNLGVKPFHIRTRLSTSTLDAVMVNLMKNINRIPNDLSERYYNLVNSEELEELTTIGTTDPGIVKQRFLYVKKFLFG